jgi:PAS domain S-box-containing protein
MITPGGGAASNRRGTVQAAEGVVTMPAALPESTRAAPVTAQAPGGDAPGDPAAVDAEVREELAQARALLEHAPDAIVILDVDTGRFTSVNASAEQLFGMDRGQLLGVGPVEVSPLMQPDGRRSAEAAWAHIERALTGGRPRFEWTHQRADGRAVPCEITLLRLPSADRRLVRGSILDITERLEAEAARRATVAAQAARRAAEAGAAQLQAMVAGLNAILWERDPETLRVRFINARAEELLGYPTEQWLTDDGLAQRIVHPDDREAALARLRAAVAEDTDFTMSYRAQSEDGRWLWLQHLGHVARDEAGKPTALHAVIFDVTDQRRREQAAAMLAEAGQALAADGPVEQRLGAVAGLTLGLLGERAVVWLAGDDHRYRMVAAAPADLAAQVRGLPSVLAPEELRPMIAAGRPFTVEPFTEETRREALHGDPALQRLAAADPQPRRQLVVPLQHGGEQVGLLTFFTAHLYRRFDPEDLALAEDLGRRIAAMVAAERVTVRHRQLHELTTALSAAGTVNEAAGALTDGLRRVLGASVASVCTLGPDGLLHTVQARGYPPDREAGYAAMRLSAPFPIPEAARIGRPVWLGDRRALEERYPGIGRHLREATQASAALPLLAPDRVMGALGLAFTTPRRFDASERAFLSAVADQVAVALERAALADVRREMAETLQRSLLPARLPEVDGLAVVTRYLPAVRGTAAGGDWYDLHQLADGQVALAVGDIVGDGAPAAAVMGQLRSSLGALLLAGHPPAEALTLLDRIADDVPGSAVSTVACLRLDPGTGELTYSRAGHLPPLLIGADGAACWLDGARGSVLGLANRAPRPEARTTLPAGTTLLLFTDGLIERRGDDLDAGLSRLATAATARRDAPLDALVDGLIAVLVDGGAADDIAVVGVRPHLSGR